MFLRISICLTGLVLIGASLWSVHIGIQNNTINQLIMQVEKHRPLCECLYDDAGTLKYIGEFVNIGKPVIPTLIKLINHEWPVMSYVAVVSLGELNAKEATPYLIEQLNNEYSVDGPRAITDVLIKFNAKEYIPQFINLAAANQLQKKAFAALALGKFKAKEAIPVLIKLLDDEHFYIRGFAAMALVEVGAKDKLPKEFIEDI